MLGAGYCLGFPHVCSLPWDGQSHEVRNGYLQFSVTANIEMKTLLILSILLIFTLVSKGQYPFEKYPAVKYSIYHDWKIYDRTEEEKKVHFNLTPAGADLKSLPNRGWK